MSVNIPYQKYNLRNSGKESQKKKFGPCALCGQKGDLTDDHIPPKCIFPENKRGDLITVPTCKSCNGLSSKDDEYSRLVLCGVYEEAESLSKPAFRGLTRKGSECFQKRFLGSIRYSQFETSSGLYLGYQWGVEIDCKRIKSLVLKIARGLYYRHWKSSVPESYELSVAMSLELKDTDLLNDDTIKELFACFRQTNWYCVGEDVFMYKFLNREEDKGATTFFMSFFKRMHFFVFITPKEVNATTQKI